MLEIPDIQEKFKNSLINLPKLLEFLNLKHAGHEIAAGYEPNPSHMIVSCGVECQFFNANLQVFVSPDIGLKIASSVLQEQVSAGSIEIEDALIEMLNIITGQVKQYFAGFSYMFELSKYHYFEELRERPPHPNSLAATPIACQIQTDSGALDLVWSLYRIKDSNKITTSEKTDLNRYSTIPGFVPIAAGEFSAGQKLNFDLHILLPLGKKLVLYIPKDSVLDPVKVEKYKQFKAISFYIPADQKADYVKHIVKTVTNLIKNEDPSTVESKDSNAENKLPPSKEHIKQIRVVVSNLLQSLDTTDMEMREEMFDQIIAINREMIKNVLGEQDPCHKLLKLLDPSDDIKSHMLNVQSICTLAMLGLGYVNKKVLSDMGVAALLHDIGLCDFPKEHLFATVDKMPVDLQTKFMQHTQSALEIMSQHKTSISDESKIIIMQHHENVDGSGFPLGIRSVKIYELAKVLSIVDEFEKRMVMTFKSGKTSIKEVLSTMVADNRKGEPKRWDDRLLNKIVQLLIK